MKNNDVKKRIQLIMFLPIIMALVLMGVSIYLFGTETPEGIATLVVLGVYMLISVITFFRISPEISRTLMDYSMEHGKVQKELLRELDVPYAILDQDAQILWANDKTLVGKMADGRPVQTLALHRWFAKKACCNPQAGTPQQIKAKIQTIYFSFFILPKK